MDSSYHPKRVECAWYDWWWKSNFFKPEYVRARNPNAEKFVMVIPPPNVTGQLHLGHALTNSVEDTITRWNRMNGREALWVPATDHAGIATQVVVEKKLQREEGKTRHDLGRENFVAEVWKWKEQYGEAIKNQLRRLGSSLDWDREAFTMDERLSVAVTETFCRLYEKGLIYRENKLVNWCCALRTAISDIEVDYKDFEEPVELSIPGHAGKYRFGEIISFAYEVEGTGEKVYCETTRLETMLGDTAVAVHPDDKRYAHLHGKYVVHPFDGRRIPIICDKELVDMSFGTGCVKVTPAHDPNDYACGVRNKLPFITVFTEDGKIAPGFGKFSGMPRFDARIAICEALKEKGLFKEVKKNPMHIGFCSRTGDVIEPRLVPQWYVNCKGMAEKAIEKARTGELQFFPETQKEVWYRWLESIRDWCVSRQLWWGHRIPAYLVGIKGRAKMDPAENSSWVVARTEAAALKLACERFKVAPEDVTLERDPDVLDTWFSSGIYPFSVFGWPDEGAEDFRRYFPTTLLETGHDILFFWVARMVMLSLELTGKLPFNQIYLHAMVRDAQGRKMSKSLGNVIDPIDVIEGITLERLNEKLLHSNLPEKEIKTATEGQRKNYPNGIAECGTDALRFALCAYTSQGRNINLDVNRVVGYRNFCNKIWNATRFGLMKLKTAGFVPLRQEEVGKLRLEHIDRWILSKLAYAVRTTQENMAKYEFSGATTAVYNFWLYELCDVYLESIKPVFLGADEEAKEASRQTLCLCLDMGLRLLHPFMPFVTEELWQHLPKRGDEEPSIMVAKYPDVASTAAWHNPALEDAMQLVSETVSKIRGANAPYVAEIKKKGKEPAVTVVCADEKLYPVYEEYLKTVELLSYTKGLKLARETPSLAGCVTASVNDHVTVVSDLKDIIDPKLELEKLSAKLAKLTTDIALAETKAGDKLFQEKTPEKVKENFINKLAAMKKEKESVELQIKELSK